MPKLYKVYVYAIQPQNNGISKDNIIGTIIVKKSRFSAKEIKYNRYMRIYDNLNNSNKTQQTFPLNDIKLYGRSLFIKQSEFIKKNIATEYDISLYLSNENTCIDHEMNIDNKFKEQVKINKKIKR